MRYVPDHQGIGRMLMGPEMRVMSHAFAEAGMTYAKLIAPVGDRKDDATNPRYVDSFEIQSMAAKVTKRGGRRQIARLHNKADHAAHVEWGLGELVLTRTIDFIEGIRF